MCQNKNKGDDAAGSGINRHGAWKSPVHRLGFGAGKPNTRSNPVKLAALSFSKDTNHYKIIFMGYGPIRRM